jgi:hypothetical protein
MKPTVRVHLSGHQDLETYQSIVRDIQRIMEEDVRVEISRTRSLDIASAIIITIVGNVAAHYIIKLADLLMAKKSKGAADVNIIIVYNDIEFALPADRLNLNKALRDQINKTTYNRTKLEVLSKKESVPRMKKKIVILFLAADPSNAGRFRLGEEFREIQDQLRLAKQRKRFELHERMSVRPADLSQALLDLQPQIVHFSGNGTINAALCFENESGEVHPLDPHILAALFEQFDDQVSCVVLNACYSELQAVAIAKNIDYVVGMKQPIGDKAAIAFASGFYQALAADRTIEEAYKLGCVQIGLQGIPEHLTPILIKKGKTKT